MAAETHQQLPSLDKDVRTPPAARFCSRCGRRALPSARERVCRACGQGIVLACEHSEAPSPGTAFAIVSYDLVVQAVSLAGECILGPEQSAVGRPLLSVLDCPEGTDLMARVVRRAALRPGGPTELVADAIHDGTDELRNVRVTTCGAPRAALLSLS